MIVLADFFFTSFFYCFFTSFFHIDYLAHHAIYPLHRRRGYFVVYERVQG